MINKTDETRKLKHVNNEAKETEIIPGSNYLILGDSNTRYIKSELLNRKYSTSKVFCVYFKDVTKFCEKVKINKNPEKILIHCGCNDLDLYEADGLKIIPDLESCKNLTRQVSRM